MESTRFDPWKQGSMYYIESSAFPGKYLEIKGAFLKSGWAKEVVPAHYPTPVNINVSKQAERRRIYSYCTVKKIYVWFDRKGDIEAKNKEYYERAQFFLRKHRNGAHSIQ